MSVKNQAAILELFINEVVKHETLTAQSVEVNNYLHNLLNEKYYFNSLDENIFICVLNTLNFKLFCKIITTLDTISPGFLLHIISKILNNLNSHINEDMTNGIDDFYLKNIKLDCSDKLKTTLWNTKLQEVTNKVLVNKITVNEDELFFARIKLLLDSKLMKVIENNQIAFSSLIYNLYNKSLISKLSPIFSSEDKRVINNHILIRQYCRLQLKNRHQDDFLESLSKENAKNIYYKYSLLDSGKDNNNLEFKKYINLYLKQIKKVSAKMLIKLIEEIFIVLNKLSLEDFIRIFSFIDKNHPGLSYHYVLKARNESSWNKESFIFLKRIKKIQKEKTLNKIISPGRLRLVEALLEEYHTSIENNEELEEGNNINNEDTFIDLLKNSEIFNVEDRE